MLKSMPNLKAFQIFLSKLQVVDHRTLHKGPINEITEAVPYELPFKLLLHLVL